MRDLIDLPPPWEPQWTPSLTSTLPAPLRLPACILWYIYWQSGDCLSILGHSFCNQQCLQPCWDIPHKAHHVLPLPPCHPTSPNKVRPNKAVPPQSWRLSLFLPDSIYLQILAATRPTLTALLITSHHLYLLHLVPVSPVTYMSLTINFHWPLWPSMPLPFPPTSKWSTGGQKTPPN